MVPYTSFLPYVLPYVMGCSEPLAVQAVRDICIEFAEHTLITTATLDPMPLIAGIDTYDLDATPGTVVQQITQAWIDGDRLTVISADSLETRVEMFNRTFPDANKEPGRPSALMQNPDNTFTLNAIPGETVNGAITIRALVKPTRTSSTVDTLIFNDYAPAIGAGAVAKLMNIPNEPFSNPGMAPVHDSVYLRARHQARIRANKGMGRTNLQVKFRSM